MTIYEFLSFKVSQVFLHPYEPLSEDLPAGEVIDYMREKKTSCVMLSNKEGAVSGVFTERDLTKFFEEIKRETSISKFMTKNPYSLSTECTLGEVLGVMQTKGIRHVAINSQKGEFYSVISMRDVASMFIDNVSDEEADAIFGLVKEVLKE